MLLGRAAAPRTALAVQHLPRRFAATSAAAQQQQQQQQQQQPWRPSAALAAAAVGGVVAATLVAKWVDHQLHADAAAKDAAGVTPLTRFKINKATGDYPKWYHVGVDNSRSRIKPPHTPEHYDHVIVGAGQAARACLDTINGQLSTLSKAFARSKVLLVAEERATRINAVVTSQENKEQLRRLDTAPNTTVILGPAVSKLDVHSKLIQLSDGRIFSYGKLFIGTGGMPTENLPCTNEKACERLFNLRTLNDLERLDKIISSGKVKNIAVVGGGTFGVEAALEIFQRNRDKHDVAITQIYAEPGVMYKLLPEYFRAYITARLRSLGIAQKNFSLVSKVDTVPEAPEQVYVEIDSWEKSYLKSDLVVYAPTTVNANVELAADAGLEIDENNGGIVVNQELSACTDIYAGGDVISYPNVVLGRRRDQNYDHAVASGVIAAHNMLGEHWPYYHLPANRVDMRALGLRIETVGVVDARCETIGIWDASRRRPALDDSISKYDRGVIYYLNNGFIVGVMLVNIDAVEGHDNPIDMAREVLYDQVDYTGVENVEAELRDLIPHARFEATTIKHVNARSVVRDVVHGKEPRKNGSRNPFKVRRTLMVDAKTMPEDFLRLKGSPNR